MTGTMAGDIAIVTPFEVSFALTIHGSAVVITAVTTFPFVRVEVVKVVPVAPATIVPFTYHCIAGFTPPFVVVAVKVRGLPAHVGLVPEVKAIVMSPVNV